MEMQPARMGVTNETPEFHLSDPLHPPPPSLTLSLSPHPSLHGWSGDTGSHVTVLRVSESQSSATEIIAM